MSQPYVGEIRMFAGNFAPSGWMFCDGSLLPISEQETLFNLIGTTYGGDGQSTFALPDLQGRLPMHAGNGHVQAETGGQETVTLTTLQIPNHSHTPLASNAAADQTDPTGALFANTSPANIYAPASPPRTAVPRTTAMVSGSSGGSQPHDNMQPYVCINFVISLYGVFPSQT